MVFVFLIILSVLFIEGDFNIKFLFYGMGATVIGACFTAIVIKFIARVEVKDAKQATKIFEAFGYQRPSEVNLHDNCLKVRLKEKENTGKFQPMSSRWFYRYRDSDLNGGLE